MYSRVSVEELYGRIADQNAPDFDLYLAMERWYDWSRSNIDASAVRDEWETYLRKEAASERPQDDLHFYVHIPFCRQICRYCCYYKTVFAQERAAAYLHWLEGAMDFFAPAFAKRAFQTLYVGGGTPSVLTAAQIARLFEIISSRFSFSPGGEHAFECNVDSVDAEKLDALAQAGVNRISMGVQTFDSTILNAEHRGYQTPESVRRAVALVQASGKFVLSLDLIVGLHGDTPEGYLRSIDELLDLNPTEVCTYSLHPTRSYFSSYGEQWNAGSYFHDLAQQYLDIVPVMERLGADRGYQMSTMDGRSWGFRKRSMPPRFFSAVYSDTAPEMAGLFALGPSSWSRIRGALRYAQDEEIPSDFDAARPLFNAQRITGRDEMIAYAMRCARAGRPVELGAVHALFGETMASEFEMVARQLEASGTLAREGEEVHFPPDARQRFIAGLRFLDPAYLQELVVTDIVVRATDPIVLRISHVSPNRHFAAITGRIGLAVIRNAQPCEQENEIIELAVRVFRALGDRRANVSLPEFTDDYFRYLDRYLERLRREGRYGELPVEMLVV